MTLAGGHPVDVAAATEVCRAWSSRIEHLGDHGRRARAKLAVNALLAVQAAALADLVAILAGADGDLARALDVVVSLPVCSPAAARVVTAMTAPEPPPSNFPVRLVAKDLGYAAALGSPSGMVAAAARAFSTATAAGGGDADVSAIAVALPAPHQVRVDGT